MRVSPKDLDKLILHNAGFVAQKRYARGLKLNYPESVALIATQLLEFIRDGESVSTLMNKGKMILGLADVMPGVADILVEVQVEGTFPDGTKLVTVHTPICRESGSPELALYGSGLSKNPVVATSPEEAEPVVPGEFIIDNEELELNKGRKVISLEVTNMGDRPVQVGSHYPFLETNAALRFDREKSYGFRLNIPSGTAVRFEPGESKMVQLVDLVGERKVFGGNNLINGDLSTSKAEALQKVKDQNFLSTK